MDYVGSRWYKCDFHIHTMKSQCYANKNDTYEEWISAAVDKGLDCLAVTDHNDCRSIDALIALGKEKGITVFPGVELTCSDAKVHMLILFDIPDGQETVYEFLIRAGISRRHQHECGGGLQPGS